MPNFKIGEEVIVYVSDYKFTQYENQSRFKGKLIRPYPPIGKSIHWKVELYGTGSQDTEGHNVTATVHEKALRKIKR